MTDEPKNDPLGERVAIINKSVMKLSDLAYRGVIASGQLKADDNDDAIELIQSVGNLVGIVIVSLSEIADSVGKLARQAEVDFKLAVEEAATVKASVNPDEPNKRSFLGQPRKSD